MYYNGRGNKQTKNMNDIGNIRSGNCKEHETPN